MPHSLQLALLASIALLLSACAGPGNLSSDYQRYQYTAIGTAAGALAGGVLGHQFDGDDGRYYGAAAGALLGGALGNNMDQIRAYNGTAATTVNNKQAYPAQPYPAQPYEAQPSPYNNNTSAQPPSGTAQPY